MRLTYYRDKKVPQLRWMLQQARQLVEARAASAAAASARAAASAASARPEAGGATQTEDGQRLTEEDGRCRRRAADGAKRPAGGGAGAAGGAGGDEYRPSADRPLLVVDLGCGKGDFALLLAAAMPALSVVGVDTNAEAIAYAQSRARDAGLANARFRTADASELDAGCGDAGWCGDVLVALHACGGLSDVALALAARSGASCLICTCCFNKHRYPRSGAQTLLTRHTILSSLRACLMPCADESDV